MSNDAKKNPQGNLLEPKTLKEVMKIICDLAHNMGYEKKGKVSFLNTKYEYFTWQLVQSIKGELRKQDIVLIDKDFITDETIEEIKETVDSDGVLKKNINKKTRYWNNISIILLGPVKVGNEVVEDFCLVNKRKPCNIEFTYDVSSDIVKKWSKQMAGLQTFDLRTEYLKLFGLYEETESGIPDSNNNSDPSSKEDKSKNDGTAKNNLDLFIEAVKKAKNGEPEKNNLDPLSEAGKKAKNDGTAKNNLDPLSGLK